MESYLPTEWAARVRLIDLQDRLGSRHHTHKILLCDHCGTLAVDIHDPVCTQDCFGSVCNNDASDIHLFIAVLIALSLATSR